MTRVITSADAEAYSGSQVPLEEVRATLEGTELYATGESSDADQVGVLTDVSVRVAEQTTGSTPKPLDDWPDPDLVGTSEYCAIHEVREDVDDPELLAAILAAFIDTASALLRRELSPMAGQPADSWMRMFSVSFVGTRGTLVVVVTKTSGGCLGPQAGEESGFPHSGAGSRS